MKKYQITILALSILFTALGVGFGIRTNIKNKALELENNRLKKQLSHRVKKQEHKKIKNKGRKKSKKKNASEIRIAGVETKKNIKNRSNESFFSWLQRLKKENPEEYEKRMQRRKDFQERIKYAIADRTLTFMDLDTSQMTEEELVVHNELIDRMTSTMEIIEQMDDPEKFDRKVMGKMFREVRKIQPLMAQERATMLNIMSAKMGLKGAESAEFLGEVNKIISATSMQMSPSRRKKK